MISSATPPASPTTRRRRGFSPERCGSLHRRWTPRELVRLALGLGPVGPIGRFSYASTNYVLLGLVVERAAGRPLAEELRSRHHRAVAPDGDELRHRCGHRTAGPRLHAEPARRRRRLARHRARPRRGRRLLGRSGGRARLDRARPVPAVRGSPAGPAPAAARCSRSCSPRAVRATGLASRRSGLPAGVPSATPATCSGSSRPCGAPLTAVTAWSP